MKQEYISVKLNKGLLYKYRVPILKYTPYITIHKKSTLKYNNDRYNNLILGGTFMSSLFSLILSLIVIMVALKIALKITGCFFRILIVIIAISLVIGILNTAFQFL